MAAALSAATASAALSVSGGAEVARSPSNIATELSGITWAGGETYYAVNDAPPAGTLFKLSIRLNPDGEILSCAVGDGVPLAGSRDLEGCAYDPVCGTVWVSMEKSSTPIREYNPKTGEQLRTAPVPGIFIDKRRTNYGFEALTISPDGMAMWTCNEEALLCDGPKSSTEAGSVVRLLRFSRSTPGGDWTPDGQWAYQAEPLGNAWGFGNSQRSGVAGLCALPDGTLLVLEREFSNYDFKLALFQVDFTGATEISSLPSLANAKYAKVGKHPLVGRMSTGFVNYEGVCLGPPLPESSRALLFISDAGGSPHLPKAAMSKTLTAR